MFISFCSFSRQRLNVNLLNFFSFFFFPFIELEGLNIFIKKSSYLPSYFLHHYNNENTNNHPLFLTISRTLFLPFIFFFISCIDFFKKEEIKMHCKHVHNLTRLFYFFGVWGRLLTWKFIYIILKRQILGGFFFINWDNYWLSWQ